MFLNSWAETSIRWHSIAHEKEDGASESLAIANYGAVAFKRQIYEDFAGCAR
jgi:hypothetical protein